MQDNSLNQAPEVETPVPQMEAKKPVSAWKPLILGIILTLLLVGGGVALASILSDDDTGGDDVSPTPTVTTTAAANPTDMPTSTDEPDAPEATAAPTTTAATTVKLYLFSEQKFIDAEDDVFVVKNRTTTRADIATFAVEQLIIGPNATEQAQGLAGLFGEGEHVEFTSVSNCSGKDFKISIAARRATIQFCRGTQLLGDFSGSFATAQIAQTVNQFSTVDSTRVLNVDGGCFNDMAGLPASECYQ